MKYVYILDENQICVQISNFYEDSELVRVVGGKDYVVKNDKIDILGYKYENGEFINHSIEVTTNMTDSELILSQILLDIQELKDKLGGV